MHVLVEDKWGVIEGASRPTRQVLARTLNTETRIVGDRVKFIPTRDSLDYLAHQSGVTFDPGCRTAWGHFYRRRRAPEAVDFHFKTEPFKHQRDVWTTARDMPYFALLWEMGLGKTKTALDIAAWKYATGKIDAVLVITLKGVHRNWVTKEVPAHLSVDKYQAAYWNINRVEGGMRGLVEAEGLAIATVNFDTIFQKKGEAFCRRFLTSRRAMVIVDESHNIKTPSAARTKACLKFAKLACARLIMTGTPITNAPLDLWSQFEFVSPKIMGCPNYYLFQKRYAVTEVLPGVTNLVWRVNKQTGKREQVEKPVEVVVGYKNIDELKSRIEPYASRLIKDEVLDLPPKVYRVHAFDMTDEQRRAYAKMKKDLVIELQGGRRMSAQLAITKLLRLQQLACGFVVPDDANPEDPDTRALPFGKSNPRLAALMQVLEEVHGKAIIWAHYRYSLHEIAAALRETYGDASVVTYDGATSEADRERAENAFQDPDSPVRFFVGQPQAGGTGITLTRARDVIYYSNSFNLTLRLQSEDRAHRIGQTGTVTYTDLEAVGSLDRRIFEALRRKFNLAAEITGDDLRDWLSEAA